MALRIVLAGVYASDYLAFSMRPCISGIAAAARISTMRTTTISSISVTTLLQRIFTPYLGRFPLISNISNRDIRTIGIRVRIIQISCRGASKIRSHRNRQAELICAQLIELFFTRMIGASDNAVLVLWPSANPLAPSPSIKPAVMPLVFCMNLCQSSTPSPLLAIAILKPKC